MRSVLFSILICLGFTAKADTFELMLDLRHAQSLYDHGRYKDSTVAFDNLHWKMKPVTKAQIDTYLVVLDYLARSISQRGLTHRVTALMRERHGLIQQFYDDRGYLHATSLARLAESTYRDGDRESAIELTNSAIHTYQRLYPVPQAELDLARKNIAQYKVADFSAARLPRDLSDFYSNCEQLREVTDPAYADTLMSEFIEIGVDYVPEGEWREFFDAIKYPAVQSYQAGSERRVFIPDTTDTMMDELCFVSIEGGNIVSVESFVE